MIRLIMVLLVAAVSEKMWTANSRIIAGNIEPKDLLWDGNNEDMLHGSNFIFRGIPQTWRNRTLVFEIDYNLFSDAELSVIKDGMNEISSQTCITFRRRMEIHDVDFVNITRTYPGCWSKTGRVGGQQILNLHSDCTKKDVVVRYLMHTLGFHYEHQRPTRNDYITINFGNVQKHSFTYFSMQKEAEELAGVLYDYQSILHGGMYDFAVDPSIPTIIPKNPNVTLGGEKLTHYDKMKVHKLYKC